MLKRPTNSILKNLTKDNGEEFLKKGLKEINEVLILEGIDGILFPDYDAKYQDGIRILEEIGFNQQTIELYRMKYEILVIPVKKEYKRRAEIEKMINLEKYNNLYSLPKNFPKKLLSTRNMRRN